MEFELIHFIFLIIIGLLSYILLNKSPSSSPSSSKRTTTTTATTKASKGKEKTNALSLKIIYASQSGNAENFSSLLAKDTVLYDISCAIKDISEFDMGELTDQTRENANVIYVFLVATYGEGDPTDSAIDFNKILVSWKKEENPVNAKFSIFGLGNKQYEHYCGYAIKLQNKLLELGGTEFTLLGKGDDDDNLEADFNEWKSSFWTQICNSYGLKKIGGMSYECPPIVWEGDLDTYEADPALYRKRYAAFDVKYPVMEAYISEHKDIVTDITEVTIALDKCIENKHNSNLTASKVKFITAYNAGIHSRNNQRIASLIAKRLNLNLNSIFTSKMKKDGKRKVPSPCSVRDALWYHLDIISYPKCAFLEVMAFYAKDPVEAKKLQFLASKEGKEEYVQLVINKYMNLLDILNMFPSVTLNMDALIEYVPRVQPRYYTIASSNKVNPQAFSLVFNLVKEKKDDIEFQGVASTFMNSLKVNEPIYIHIKPSEFKFPEKPVPMIMVGPGTGFAPFVGFLQELNYLKKQGVPLCQNIIFFGCKYSKEWIYENEMKAAEQDGIISLHTAFSRDQAQKVYVQHRIAENAALVSKLLLEQNASIFVCGATSMGRDVKTAFIQAISTTTKCSSEEATDIIKKLVATQRYVQELW